MAMNEIYIDQEPGRAEVDALQGATVLEFGTSWCGHCQAAQPLIRAALTDHTSTQHLKIEDGRGRILGRTYKVKLWPTLIFLRDGHELARLIRPDNADAIRQALTAIQAE